MLLAPINIGKRVFFIFTSGSPDTPKKFTMLKRVYESAKVTLAWRGAFYLLRYHLVPRVVEKV
jgi:hypothetical protein